LQQPAALAGFDYIDRVAFAVMLDDVAPHPSFDMLLAHALDRVAYASTVATSLLPWIATATLSRPCSSAAIMPPTPAA
jgi:hypothetical protein